MNPLKYPLHVAVPTAFDENETLDCQKTIAHMLHLQKQGIRSFLVCGSTGEQHSLSLSEKICLVDALAAETRFSKDAELLFGVAAIRYQEAQLLAMHIAQTSTIASIVLGFPPYICPTQSEAIAYAKGLILAVKKPVILYNNPRRTGFDLSEESLYILAQNSHVVGLKEAGDFKRIPAIKPNLSDDFRMYAGGEQDLIKKVQLGFDGLSSMAGNLYPQEMIDCWQELSSTKNLDTETPAWIRLMAAAAGDPSQTVSYLPWLKAQLATQQANFGHCRKPLGMTSLKGANQ
ncbi:dihydrodipicolinate synthase family protein [Enterococcus sp. DIV0876]|uniref:dihydrodipicolinate synthase family protein n=1 Tax=Enterococcus sp. DIV0876 TaxID=2774633 RepID=UPI003D2FE9E4